jgi:ABC-type lipoprotein export system ATPase subunit
VFRLYGDGGAVALQGLTMSVQAGEVVVVFGPSGSGKSTLLRILAGLDLPSAGTVHVFGDDLRELRGRALREYRARVLGYVDQHYAHALAPELTARELVGLRLELLGVAGAERVQRAEALLERVGLGDRGDAHPRELSGGQQQRVALAAALAHEPKLLIADEPTGELDAENAQAAYRLIGELAREHGATTVVVSHDPQAATIADRVIHVRDGRVSAESAAHTGHAEEIVLARGGWLRVPEDLLRISGIEGRAAARAEDGKLVLEAVGEKSEAGDRYDALAPYISAAENVVSISDVRKSYGDRPVLDGVSAAFAAGRFTAVTGRSGSGKTTLLHLLAGLDRADAGTIEIAGRPADASLLRTDVALVAQDAHLVPFLSARENVELALELRGADTAAARDALAAVGLGELVDERVDRLSTGERQRVALARAIAAKPKLLLADEPTARLDEANARNVGALFARLAAETGTAIVAATHDPALIEQADAELPLATSAS